VSQIVNDTSSLGQINTQDYLKTIRGSHGLCRIMFAIFATKSVARY